ncbi:GAF and ANTAR domain-containing protein [Amycolatopsis sp., V23-08]|uniref:GAF and ANTAR domain-containing protein n=1 Tax=Amycolatopsis heterodermiae TaxID=3110235 RepID=A0ABU5R454_9PSEU|nr:GAF and ANTAR domain-containing protein [Amycolatopsis sp., V23-08]MEA5360990.1 GAF and ANTAR domain-containing protein [Amycolatopsis sp., V23-08]
MTEPSPEALAEIQTGRERRVSRAFVALADTLVADFDIADFLTMVTTQLVDLLGVTAVGVILRASDGRLRVAATSSHRSELLELFAVETDDGPCIDCVRSGKAVSSRDLRAESGRWPRFAAAAHECGFRSAQALPMRLRATVIGGLTLLGSETGAVGGDDLALAQALADVATIGILQQRTIEHGGDVADQLQAALDSRVVIEQAKGILAQRGRVSTNEAFARLRGYARARRTRLTDVAAAVVDGRTDLAAVLGHPHA